MQKNPSHDRFEKRSAEPETEPEKHKQAEPSRQTSEALFRALFDNMPSGCAIYEVIGDGSQGTDYIVNNFNKAGLRIEGKTLAEVVGKSLFELRPNIDDYGLVPVLKKVWETGIPDFFPVKIYQDGNFSNYYEYHVFKLSSGEVAAIYNDVTEQKKAKIKNATDRLEDEKARRQSEAHLRTVVDTIPDLVWLKDPDGVYLSCNPTFERFFGAKESEIVGKRDYDFKNKELSDFFRMHDRRAIEANGPRVNEEWLTFADNGYRGLFETIKKPMRDAGGNLIGVLGIARDITERKKAADALKENEQRYKKAQRIGQVGNWEFDPVTEKFWGSDEAKRIYGFDPENADFTTADVESCIPERERVHQALIDLLEKNKPYNLEFEICPSTGAERKFIKSIAEAIRDDSGDLLKIVGVIQDITQQKNAEKEKVILERQLRQSQKLESIGLLAGGIAHDFNNILTAIIGYTELALDEVESGARLEDDLQEVLTAGKRAKGLVRQILAFARQSDEVVKPVRIDTIAREALQLIRSTILATIEIRQDLKSNSLVMGNSAQVHQIFMNLCTNAVHAMEGDGGILTVGLEDVHLDENAILKNKKLEPGDYLQLAVSDTKNQASNPGHPLHRIQQKNFP